MTNILLVGHASIQKLVNFGGTEYLYTELSSLTGNYNVITMTPRRFGNQITWEVGGKLIEVNAFQGKSTEDGTIFGDDAFTNWFIEVLIKCQIDLVHVFHNLNNPLTIIPISSSMGLGTMITLHDYSHYCDSFNLLDYEEKYCGSNETPSASRCINCADQRRSNMSRILSLRVAYSKIFDCVDFVAVGSTYHKNSLISLYGIEENRVSIIPPKVPKPVAMKTNKISNTVAVLGNLSTPKGARLIQELISNKELDFITFEHAGRIDAEHTGWVKGFEKNGRLRTLGQYEFGKFPELESKVAFFGSIWPETFCIAATEALELGLRIVVPRTGAFIERFSTEQNATMYEIGNTDSAIAAIKEAVSLSFVQHDTSENSSYKEGYSLLYDQNTKKNSNLKSADTTAVSLNFPSEFFLGNVWSEPLRLSISFKPLLRKFLRTVRQQGLLASLRRVKAFLKFRYL
jgi:glycosyltransferase involved in cell wall biosynthesis